MERETITDLITREELEIECRSVGREVESKILARQPPTPLENEELDTIFSPLIDQVEERARVAVQHELDEYQGQMKDIDATIQRENIMYECRANLSETLGKLVIHSSDDSHTRTFIRVQAEYVKGLIQAHEENWPIIENWEEEYSRLDEVDEEYFYKYDEDDPYWDEYLPEIYVTLKPPYSQIIGLTREGFFVFLEEYRPSRETLGEIIENTKKYRLLKYSFEINGISETFNYMNKAWPEKKRCPHGKKRCSYHEKKYQGNGPPLKRRH